MVAFRVCNKPFKPLGGPSGRVKSREAISAISSEGTGTQLGVPNEEKDDKDSDADYEGDDHVSDAQDTDDEDEETESDVDEIYKYKIHVHKDMDAAMAEPEIVKHEKKEKDVISDAAKSDVEKSAEEEENAKKAAGSNFQVKESTEFPLPSSSLSVSSGFGYLLLVFLLSLRACIVLAASCSSGKGIDYAAGERLRKLRPKEAWDTIRRLAQYEDEGWNDNFTPDDVSLNFENPNTEQLLGTMEHKVMRKRVRSTRGQASSSRQETMEERVRKPSVTASHVIRDASSLLIRNRLFVQGFVGE
nr:hypothetical protein [Tanacetum cinerariifolium]